MKLNTLLLASAATIIASSAFAADLPSKKAAPAAGSVQVCKIGGMTGMTVPGSDTCFGLSGWVRANYGYDMNSESEDGSLDWNTWGGSYRVQADFRSNTEIGVVRGVGRLTDGDMDKAYIQFAGFTAGKKDSIADIFGTNSINFGAWSQGADGVDYKLSAGGLTFGIGAETPVNNNESFFTYQYDDGGSAIFDGNGDYVGTTTAASADRPDLIAHLSGKAGMVDFALAAVSHQAVEVYNSGAYEPGANDDYVSDTVQGYALLGRIGVSMNNVNVYGWGGIAQNASGYIGGASKYPSEDIDDGDDLDSQVWGVGATFTQGAITVGAEYAQYNHDSSGDTTDTNDLAVFATYKLAKNLSVTGEYYQSRSEFDDDRDASAEDVDSFYLRIQRDF